MRSQWKIVIIMCRYADLVQAVMDCAQAISRRDCWPSALW